MNFMTLGMRWRKWYILRKSYILVTIVISIGIPLYLLSRSISFYLAAEDLHDEINQIKLQGKANHELVKDYEAQKIALLMHPLEAKSKYENSVNDTNEASGGNKENKQKKTRGELGSLLNTMVYYILVEADDQVQLESIRIMENEFTIKGRTVSAEAGTAYVQRLKLKLKEAALSDKQGTDPANKMATFEIHGSLKGS